MIKTYQSRLQNSTWLSQSTKDQAVVKLDKMVLKMGYPDKAREIYQQLHVDSDRDLLSNVIQLAQIRHQDHLSKLTQPVDRTTWNMPGHLVNASYDPSRNDITFPAAILQAPFYSLEQSDSQNLGGIGAVIAHEISHGFDNNGAQFDEFGNLHDWWQPEDYKQFNQLTQAMIEEFDGLETAAGKVNGKLVVSENIADAGGLAAALETAMQERMLISRRSSSTGPVSGAKRLGLSINNYCSASMFMHRLCCAPMCNLRTWMNGTPHSMCNQAMACI